MGVRPDVEAVAGRVDDRAEVIEEHERPDGAPAELRQRARDRDAVAEVTDLGVDELDHGHGAAPARACPAAASARCGEAGPPPPHLAATAIARVTIERGSDRGARTRRW